jgi:multiple antibiotic resistance protein
MKELIGHSLTVFLALFAVMNPIANAAVFIGLTGDCDQASRKRIALKSIITAFCIVLFFCVLGKAIFELFGITLPAFRITGGVLIFIVGFQMLQGKQSNLHHPEQASPPQDATEADSAQQPDVAISPLAIPILAGPGTIATAMNYSATGNHLKIAVTVSAFLLLCFITFLAFIFAENLVRVVGRSGIDVVTRLMGLILAVVGTQMLIEGIHGATKVF